jgi:hypothetical protein
VWISDQHLGLEFGCQRCLDQSGGASGQRRASTRRRYRKRA